MKYKVFILDVDGVMTTGQFFYSKLGKQMKVFGPDDNDGLGLLNPHIEIRFVTGDKKGFSISNFTSGIFDKRQIAKPQSGRVR